VRRTKAQALADAELELGEEATDEQVFERARQLRKLPLPGRLDPALQAALVLQHKGTEVVRLLKAAGRPGIAQERQWELVRQAVDLAGEGRHAMQRLAVELVEATRAEDGQ